MEATVKETGQVVGFVDIGTNAVRLLVVRINPNFSYTVISQEKEMVRLGEQEFKDNVLRPEAMERAIFVCGKFVNLAKTYGATNIIAVGTSAIREALNQSEFLLRLFNETGLNVHAISGKEEARLIYLGVSSGIDIGEEKAVFIDLGGGSTEIAIGDQYKLYYVYSLMLGAIRLTTQFIGEGWTGPVSNNIYNQIKSHVSLNALMVKAKVQECGARRAWGSSGTMINLAEITNKMFKKNGNGEKLVLTRKNLQKLAPILCSLSLEERRKLPGINPERADIIVAGTAIIETIMEDFGLEEICISHKDLRDGLLVDYLSNFESFRELQKAPVRNRSVLRLGRSFNFDEQHSKTVSSLALQLFDSAKQIGLHNLSEEERELLAHAATLHDIGDYLSFNDHHLHSYYIISNAELFGFDRKEITIIANVARFHRKKLPSKKALKATGLDEESKNTIVILSTFLRLAEKLDRSHLGLISKVEFSKTGKDLVQLAFYSDTDCSLEKWSIVQNKQAFYEAFNKQLDVRCIVTPNA
ncbi:MAG: Ppx/GppA phosphatase family protein [Candidatus Bathyarchaeia archaeon]|jgi:exopolyphosphatase/guanosine-5'-triphosphate,3'-diphosphate pyrophosphatase